MSTGVGEWRDPVNPTMAEIARMRSERPGRCAAVLTPNDLSYQCEKDEGHANKGEPEHVAWRFSWRDPS